MRSVYIYEEDSEQYLYINDEKQSFASKSHSFNEGFWELCNKYHTVCRIEWRSAATATVEQALPLPLYILDTVCSRGDIEAEKAKKAAETAIEDGADINYRFKAGEIEGISFLQLAAALNVTNMVEFLLEKGSDINYQNTVKNTALHLAALQGQKEAVKLFLERGADTVLVNKEGKTAEQLSQNDEIKALFTEFNAKANRTSDYKPVFARPEENFSNKTSTLASSRSCPQLTRVY